jgi:hypothetical protein
MPAGESLSLRQLGCSPVARVETIVVSTGVQSPDETPPGVVTVIVSLVRTLARMLSGLTNAPRTRRRPASEPENPSRCTDPFTGPANPNERAAGSMRTLRA